MSKEKHPKDAPKDKDIHDTEEPMVQPLEGDEPEPPPPPPPSDGETSGPGK